MMRNWSCLVSIRQLLKYENVPLMFQEYLLPLVLLTVVIAGIYARWTKPNKTTINLPMAAVWVTIVEVQYIIDMRNYQKQANFAQLICGNFFLRHMIILCIHLGPLLLTWFNFNPSMDK